MWFVGLLAGLLLGALSGSPFGTYAGGVLGLVGGLVLREQMSNRKQTLEIRIAHLEKLVDTLSRQVAALRSASVASEQEKQAVIPGAPVVPQAIADIVHPAVLKPQSIEPPAFSRPLLPVDSVAHAQPRPHSAAAKEFLDENEWLSKLFTGNILAKIGVIILFFGIASGLKLAVDMGLFPISVRLMLGALAAIGMSIFGYLRAQQPQHRMFGLAMQGGGLGILYLLVYFMLARYQIIGETLAFVLFTLIGVSCVLLAARQDGRSLAMLGISGAFLSPVMVANSGGSQITLFSYFLLLNAFIISVNWFKGWRELNMSGFVFTLVIGMNWAFRSYQPGDFPVSETFLILFFLLYSATPVLFNLFKAPGRLSWGDGMLLYGTPLAAAALQNHLLQDQNMTLAWNACAAGAYYLLLWWAIYRRPAADTVWLEKSLLGIAIGFFTLAIPLAFNTQLTSAFWTLEGFGVLYLGVKQQRFLARLSGSALQVLAGLYFLAHVGELHHAALVLNDVYVGSLIIVIAALSSALLLQRTTDNDTSRFALPFLYWGLLWWLAAGVHEVASFVAEAHKIGATLGLCVFSFVFLEWLGTRRAWPAMRESTVLLSFAILLAALGGHLANAHVLHGILAMLMPLALLTHYWLLCRHDRDAVTATRPHRHALGYALLLALTGSELAWAAHELMPGNTLWTLLAWGVVGALGILVCLHGLQQGKWPFAQHRTLYLDTLQAPVVFLLSAWLVYANLNHSGAGGGIPYMPLLNPFDLVQLLALFAVWKWMRATQNQLMPALYGIAFLWLSAEAARLTHHWGGVPFEAHDLFASSMLQAALSMLWTAIAMSVMVYASQRKQRTLWFNGFGLLAIVGVKLMLIDLSNKGTGLWTASLIAIALLIIAASYYSPAPPKEEAALG